MSEGIKSSVVGPVGFNIPTVPTQTANFAAQGSSFVPMNATTGAKTVNLTAAAKNGVILVVQKTDGSGNAVDVGGVVSLTSALETAWLLYANGQWHVVMLYTP
jgi:hypothetical protein